jgi:hypothetical protein
VYFLPVGVHYHGTDLYEFHGASSAAVSHPSNQFYYGVQRNTFPWRIGLLRKLSVHAVKYTEIMSKYVFALTLLFLDLR